jgi:tetratricopeptide (TPR) repeat protein
MNYLFFCFHTYYPGRRQGRNASRLYFFAAAILLSAAISAMAAGPLFAQTDELFPLYDRAMRYYENADYRNAEIYFSKIVKASPDSNYGTQAAFYLGRSLIRLGRKKEALDLWQALFDKNIFIGPRAELFKLYEHFGLLDKKIAEFESKIKKEPEALSLRHEYIELLIYMNKVDQAVAEYNHIIAIRPREFYLLKNAGDLLVRFRRYKEALYYYEKLVTIQPDNELYLEAAGSVHYQLGDKEQARKYWFKIIDGGAPPHKYSSLAAILQSHNMITDAISVYAACRKNFDNPSLFFGELAELYEVNDDYNSLLTHYFDLIERMPVLFAAIEQRLAETLKRNEDAREPLCALISGAFKKNAGGNPQKLRLASLIFLMSKKYKEALEINLLLSKLTSNPVILEEYANTLNALELYDLSLNALDTIAAAYPAGAYKYNARFIKARFLKAQKRYKEALIIFDEIKNDKNFSVLYHDSLFNKAQIYFDGLDEQKKAIDIFNALETSSSNFYYDSIYYKGAHELYNKSYETAEALLEQICKLKDHPRSASAFAQCAYSKIYQGSYEAGLDSLRDLITGFPAFEGAGGVFLTMKIITAALKDNKDDLLNYFEAEREYKGAHFNTAEIFLAPLCAKDGPLKYDAMRLLYKTKLKQKKYDEFKKQALEFISSSPEEQLRAEALFELAAHCIEKEKNTREAGEYLETILKKYPGALLGNKSKKMLSAIKGDDKIDKKTRDSFFGYN